MKWFVSRHPGARLWLEQQGLQVDHVIAHLNPQQVQSGDTVYGTLPIQLAAQVCMRGAYYWHLSLILPAEVRGRELSAEEMRRYGASLEPYNVTPG
jgi:CRISPR-associated protein Csx16